MRFGWVIATLLLAGVIDSGYGFCGDKACVTGVHPQQGSLAGGTRITLAGQMFAKNLLNLANDPNIGNQVNLVSDKHMFPCDIHKDGCTETQITCYTRPMPENRYYVRVKIDGVSVEVKMHCNHDEGKSYSCSFHVRKSRTPTIQKLTPYAANPQDLITIEGKIFTDVTGSNMAGATNDRTETLLRFWMTDNLCELFKDGANDELYHFALNGNDTDFGSITCKPSGSFVGYRNASFIISDGFGRSQADIELYRLSGDDKIYNLETFADVNSISLSEGSTEGGTVITIEGSYFDETTKPVEVYIGGAKAEAEYISKSEIKCVTPPKPDNPKMSGNRGIFTKRWNFTGVMDLELSNVSDITEEPVSQDTLLEFQLDEEFEGLDNFVSRTSGYFLAPSTNAYTFYLYADDEALLYISEDGNPDNKKNVLYAEVVSLQNKAATTEPMELNEGQLVYLEVLHREKRGKAAMRLSVHLAKTNYNSRHSGDVVDEVHTINTSVSIFNEIQDVSFPSTSSGSSVREEWSITLTYTDPTDRTFQIDVQGVKTAPIAVNGGADAVKYALSDLAISDYSDAGASTTDRWEVTQDGDKVYKISFPADKGSFGDVTAKVAPGSPSFGINAQRVKVGKASGQLAAFKLNGVTSQWVKTTDISPKKLTSVLENSQGVGCPRSLVKPVESSYFQDYEKVTSTYEESGVRTNEIAPHCGRNSIKNPRFLYSAGTQTTTVQQETTQVITEWKSGVPATKPMFCFGFLGKINDDFYVVFRHSGLVNGRTFSFEDYLTTGVKESHDHTDWRYRCIDLLKQIQTILPEASASNTEFLYVSTSNNETDIEKYPNYFDVVSFTAGIPAPLGSTINSKAGISHIQALNLLSGEQRRIPSKWGIESVAVSEVQGSNPKVYSVNMTAVNCIHGLDLMELANAESVTKSGQTKESSYGSGIRFLAKRTQAATPGISGDFSLSFGSYEARNVPASIEASDLGQRINALGDESYSFGEVEVTREGECMGYIWTAQYVTAGGNHPNIELKSSNLQPSTATINVETVKEGGIYWDPIPSGLLRTPHDKPQLAVLINGRLSKAETDCSFTWSESATPTVTSTSSNTGTAGDSLTLSGTGFSTTNENNVISIGDVVCAVNSASDTSVTCTLGEGPAGDHPILFSVVGKGKAKHMPSTYSYKYTFQVSSITPTTGSVKGGTIVTLSGTGFSKDTTVTIGDATCVISDSVPNTYNTIVCVTSKGTTAGANVAVVASNNDVDAGGVNFQYTAPVSTINTVSVSVAAVEGGTVAKLVGTGFREFENRKVLVGDKEATINSSSATEIEVTLPANAQGTYDLQLYDGLDGYADNNGLQIRYPFKVTGVSPLRGSLVGGTVVDIEGEGFSATTNMNKIKFGETVCDIISVSSTQVKCRIGDMTKTHVVQNAGYLPGVGDNYAWIPANLAIQNCDLVIWNWTSPNDESVFDITQRKNSTSMEEMSNGFSSGKKVKTGTYKHRFCAGGPKSFYYSSGPVDQKRLVKLRGKIDVKERTDVRHPLSFKILDYEAEYEINTGSSGTSCDQNTLPNGCSEPEVTDNTRYSFAPLSCLTPKVSAISPEITRAGDSITFTGEGFSSACDNEVILEAGRFDAPCRVTSKSSTKLVCTLSETCDALPVGIPMAVSIYSGNLGYQVYTGEGAKSNGEVSVTPKVNSFNPQMGSKQGGTLLTISGSNFMYDPKDVCSTSRKRRDIEDFLRTGASLTQGSIQIPGCASLKSSSPSEIVCVTAPGSGSHKFQPTVINQAGSFAAEINSFSYSEEATPTVSQVTPDPITKTNNILTITGSRLGTDKQDVSVLIGDTPCVVSTVSETSLTCDAGHPKSGLNSFSLTRISMGQARSSVTEVRVTGSLTDVTPTLIGRGGGLDISINGFGFNDEDSTKVTVGGKACPIKSLSGTLIICSCPPGNAGSAPISVATGTQTVGGLSIEYRDNLTPTVSGISPPKAASGSVISVSGSGFGTDTGAVSVSFNGSTCAVATVTESQVTCTLGEHAGGVVPAEVTVNGKGLAVEVTPGDLNFTYAVQLTSVTPNTGSIGGKQSVVFVGKGFPSEGAVFSICGKPCKQVGEATSTQYTCLTPANDADSTPLLCDVTVTLANGETVSASNMYTYAGDARVTGVSPSSGGTGGGTIVTITGQNFGSSQADSSVSIDQSNCVISSFSTTEIVCTTDSHQGAVKAQVEVLISGSGMAYQESADFEYIDMWSSSFTWGGNSPPEQGDFVIIPPEMTIKLDTDTPVLKILLIQGGKVVFDKTKNILLRAEMILIVDNGTLEVGTKEEPFPPGFTATIEMYGHVRSQELPTYGSKVLGLREGTLDLHGSPIMNTWTLLAATANAGDSEITVTDEVSDWKVGHQLVIATTGSHHSQRETETKTITGISGKTITLNSPLEYMHMGEDIEVCGRTLKARAEVGYLTRNVIFRGNENAGWDQKIEACEEGFDTGEFVTQTCFQGRFGDEIGSDQFGAQILAHAPNGNIDKVVTMRISYVEFTYVGQAFRLGRYAIHYHLLLDMYGSYVIGCAIYRSFNRAVNIHGTNNVLIQRNVIYNIMGGGFFLEDGVETGNIFSKNLALFVKASSSLRNDDITPAGYWVTNPNNTYLDNHAAGGTHFGYWFRMLEHPEGPSYHPDICPRHVELGVFANNTAHSQGWFGLWIFMVYTPKEGSCCQCTEPSAAAFVGLTSWNCEKGAEWVGAGPMQFKDFLMVNNEIAGIEGKLILAGVPFSKTKGAMISGSCIVSRVDSLVVADTTAWYFAIVVPQGRGLLIIGNTFVGYNTDISAIFRVTDVQGTTSTYNGGYVYHVSESTLTSSTKIASFKWLNDGCFVDLDGTLTGVTNGKVLPKNGFMSESACPTNAAVSLGAVAGCICDASVSFFRYSFNGALPSSLEGKNVSFSTTDGLTGYAQFAEKGTTHKLSWTSLLMANTQFFMKFVDAEQISDLFYSGVMYDLGADDWVIITHELYQNPDVLTITKDVRNKTQTALSHDTHNYGDWFIEYKQDSTPPTYHASYLVTGKRTKEDDANNVTALWSDKMDRSVDFKSYLCPTPNCEPATPENNKPPPEGRPNDFNYWKDAEIWSFDGETALANKSTSTTDELLPTEKHKTITIAKDTWVVIDKSPGHNFGIVFVHGTLEFEYKPVGDLVFACTHLVIYGNVFVGWPEEPMINNVIIQLLGDRYTPDLVVEDGPNIGAKTIGVFGRFDLHGTEVKSWTRLAKSVKSGDRSITVQDTLNVKKGDKLILASTQYDPNAVDEAEVVSVAGNTIELKDELAFSHSGETYTLSDGRVVNVAGEVGLISRSIVIEGTDYGKLKEEGFGGRVIVSQYLNPEDEQVYAGYARFKNVEFRHMGQEGYSDVFDPRYALVYMNTGEINAETKPSEVTGCAFFYSYNTAIGAYGTTGLIVKDTVMYFVVGSAMILWESDHTVRQNLMVRIKAPGSFNGRREQKVHFPSAVVLNRVTGVILEGNSIAGCERIGYRIDGEVCGTVSKWKDNYAHSCLVGVGILPDEADGTSPCTMVNGFVAYKNWYFGTYLQAPYSLQLTNSIMIENTVGSCIIIYGPASSSHAYADKQVLIDGAVFVGAMPNMDCNDRLSKDNSRHEFILALTGKLASWFINGKGKTGLTIPTFTSSDNECGKMGCSGIMAYQTIMGYTKLKDSLFERFGKSCVGKPQETRDYAIVAPSFNDDVVHPMSIASTIARNSDDQSLVFVPRPNVGKINPSDCVDMDCDGLKKVIIEDTDGKYFGKASTIISHSEFEWDGDKRRGLGDYRIPSAMLSDIDGTKLDFSEIGRQRGIPRDSSCKMKAPFMAYQCDTLGYKLMHMESMDEDTETRRLSPAAFQGPLTGTITGPKCPSCTIDLINGPQDHGWCMGYTCQKRLSLLPFVVLKGERYNLVLTGTTPQNLRLHFLNAEDTEKAVVCIYYNRPWELEVFNGDGVYIKPTNSELDSNGQPISITPSDETDYMPDPDKHAVAGTNYFDREQKYLCVLLAGSKPIDIRTVQKIFLAFGMPAISEDDFFGENIVKNLALFFGIPADKIKTAKAVRSTDGSRKKREEIILDVSVTISNPVRNYTDFDPDDLTQEEFEDIASRIIDTYQLGQMEDVLGIELLSFSIVQPAPDTGSETWRVFAELGLGPTLVPQIPQTMRITEELVPLHEGAAFHQQPRLQMFDADGQVIDQMGSMTSPWQLTAYLVQVDTEWDEATLIGLETVSYSNGYFTFTDLGVSHSGEYQIEFRVTYPEEAAHFGMTSASFSVANRELAAGIVSQPMSLTEGENFDITVEIIDAVTMEKVEDVSWKGHSWACEVSLYMPDIYMGSLSAPISNTILDLDTGSANFSDLSITKYGRYFLSFHFMSTPSDMDFTAPGNMSIDVYPEGYVMPKKEVLHHIKLRFDGDFNTVVANLDMYFAAALYNQLWDQYMNVHFSNFEIYEGSIMAAFDIAGSKSDLDSMLESLWMDVKNGYTVDFNGHSVTTTMDMWVDGENWRETKDKMHGALIAVIVLLSVCLVAVIIGFIVYKYWKSRGTDESFKKEKRLPTKSRRGGYESKMYFDEKYNKLDRPSSGSSTSTGSEEYYTNEDAPIIQQVPPKTTNFDFANVRPRTSYQAPGALPPLGLEVPNTSNPYSRPVSSSHLEFQLANQNGEGMPGIDNPSS